MSYSDLPSVDSKTGIGIVELDDHTIYPMISLFYDDDDYAEQFKMILGLIMTPLLVEDLIDKRFTIQNGFFTKVTYGGCSLHVHVESYMNNNDLFNKLKQNKNNITKNQLKEKAAIQYADLDVHYDNYKNVKRFMELYKNLGYYFILLMRKQRELSTFYCCKTIKFDVDLDEFQYDSCLQLIVDQYYAFNRHNLEEPIDSVFYPYYTKLMQGFDKQQVNLYGIKKTILKTCSFVKENKYYEQLFFVKNPLLKQATYTSLFRDEILIGLDEGEPVTFKTGYVPELVYQSLEKINSLGIYSNVYPLYDSSDVFAVDKIGSSDLAMNMDETYDCKKIINKALNNRRYVLNPLGVRAKVKDDLVKEFIIREVEYGIRGYFVTKDGNYFPVFYQYEDDFYFSPMSGMVGGTTSTDPYLKRFLENWKILITTQRSSSSSRSERHEKSAAGDEGELNNTIIYLPVRKTGEREQDYIRHKEERKLPAPHPVSGHLRRTKHTSKKQIELAKQFGIALPEGFTFVKPFRTGKDKK
jgi:hypothetical protein